MADLVNRITELEALLDEERRKRIEAEKKQKTHWVWTFENGYISIVSDTLENAKKMLIEKYNSSDLQGNKGYASFNEEITLFEGPFCEKPPTKDEIQEIVSDTPMMIPERDITVFLYCSG